MNEEDRGERRAEGGDAARGSRDDAGELGEGEEEGEEGDEEEEEEEEEEEAEEEAEEAAEGPRDRVEGDPSLLPPPPSAPLGPYRPPGPRPSPRYSPAEVARIAREGPLLRDLFFRIVDLGYRKGHFLAGPHLPDPARTSEDAWLAAATNREVARSPGRYGADWVASYDDGLWDIASTLAWDGVPAPRWDFLLYPGRGSDREFIPREVLLRGTPRVRWRSIPATWTPIRLRHEIVRRSWQSPYYDPTLPRLQLEFLTCQHWVAGWSWWPGWNGYRVIVSEVPGSDGSCAASGPVSDEAQARDDGSDGARARDRVVDEGRAPAGASGGRGPPSAASSKVIARVDLPSPGPRVFMEDYSGGGLESAAHRSKRVELHELIRPSGEVGYAQIFDAIFAAFEEKLTGERLREAEEYGWIEDPLSTGQGDLLAATPTAEERGGWRAAAGAPDDRVGTETRWARLLSRPTLDGEWRSGAGDPVLGEAELAELEGGEGSAAAGAGGARALLRGLFGRRRERRGRGSAGGSGSGSRGRRVTSTPPTWYVSPPPSRTTAPPPPPPPTVPGLRTSRLHYACPADDLLRVVHVPSVPTGVHPALTLPFGAVAAWACWQLAWAVAVEAVGRVRHFFERRRPAPRDLYEALEFMESRGDSRRDGLVEQRLEDVGGLARVVHQLQDTVDFLKAPGEYSALGARPPRGILLEGPPGTGKTLVARALAGSAGVPFYEASGAEFVEAAVGVGAARLRHLFSRAALHAPALVFIDEIDAFACERGGASGAHGDEEREQTLNQLLCQLDGFVPGAGIVLVAATNRASQLDSALLRPGRFDHRVYIPHPDEAGRAAILRVLSRRLPLDPSVDLDRLARDTPGLAGADLASLLNEAALASLRRTSEEEEKRARGPASAAAGAAAGKATARRRRARISRVDIDAGVDRVTHGPRGQALTPESHTLRALAVAEAGTALVSRALLEAGEPVESVERVSVVPLRDGLSRTTLARLPRERLALAGLPRLRARMAVLLAPRAAQLVAFGRARASEHGLAGARSAGALALRAVTLFAIGPDRKLTGWAPIYGDAAADGSIRDRHSLTDAEGGTAGVSSTTDPDAPPEPLEGREVEAAPQPGEATRLRAETEAHALVREAFARSLSILLERRRELAALVGALVERRELRDDDIDSLLGDLAAAEEAGPEAAGDGSRDVEALADDAAPALRLPPEAELEALVREELERLRGPLPFDDDLATALEEVAERRRRLKDEYRPRANDIRDNVNPLPF